ncbi:N-acetylmuramoyl-L-alanine amidase, partial [Ohessyouella blattaphilus]|uniref:N-acetylmuramoyl-L-alanine amidase n=1 Tax=Ohessyouella blattaphilus TaxID=2949333 RepID=UPI003EBCBDB2
MNQKTKGSNNAMKRVVSVILIFAMVFTVGSFQAVFAVESGDVVQDKQDLIGENNEVPVLNEGDAESNPNAEVAEPQQEIDVIREQGRINYLYIESPSIAPNQQQNIVVSFGDGSENLNNIELKVSCPDGSTDKLTPSRIEKEIIVFTNTYDVENIGVFTLDSFCVSVDGVTQEIVLSEAGIEATFNVALGAEIVEEDISASVIDLSGEEDVETAVEATLESNAVKLNNNELSRNVLSRSANGNIVVVLDPGHGGRDPGASGNGLVESQVNLAIALACRDELQQYAGVEVVLTRTTDVHLGADTAADLEARVQIAKDAGADLFVCLHNNSASSSASGAEVYYPNSNHNSSVHNSGKNVAQLIQNELVALGFDNRGIKEGYSSDGSGDDAFYVIRECKAVGIPAVLVEHGFLTNASDAARLREPEKLGIANANAIASFFGLTKECALMIKPSRNVTIGDTVTFQIKTEYIENSSQYKSYRVICNPGNGNWVELSSSSKDMIRTWTADRSFTDGTILLEALRVDGTTEPLWSYAQSMSVKPAITKIKSLNFSEISNGKITIDSEIESTDRDLKYTYEVYDMNTWKGLVTESENSKVEWKPSKTGQYLINLTVKGKYGEKTSLAWGTEVKANASILSFTANKSTPQTVGSQMTLSGRADISFMSPTYRYIYYDGTSWNEIASSKVQKDVMWTPQKAGNYLLCYQILMPDGSNIDRFMGYDITGPSLTINNLTVSSLSGDGKITLNSKVTSTDTDLKYTYEVYDMKTWSTVKKDSSSSAVEWTPKKEGTYLVNVTVTGKSGTRESRAVGTSVVGTANITKFTVDKNTPRAIGEEITLSGRASVNMQNATYRYIYYDGKTWNLIASDTSQKDAVWKPQKAGNYTLCYQVVMPGGREVNR